MNGLDPYLVKTIQVLTLSVSVYATDKKMLTFLNLQNYVHCSELSNSLSANSKESSNRCVLQAE